MSKNSKMTALAAAALLLDSLSLGGCANSTTASSMDAHAEAPVSPKTSGYLTLDLPPRDEKPAMTADERLKLQKELIAARDRQASRAKAASSQPTKP
jgi:hypothetical protein